MKCPKCLSPDTTIINRVIKDQLVNQHLTKQVECLLLVCGDCDGRVMVFRDS
jgi:hypothetical protein